MNICKDKRRKRMKKKGERERGDTAETLYTEPNVNLWTLK